MTGLELAGLMGAEIRDPERTLPRAGWIASGFATVFYSSLTVALLVLLRPEKINEMNGFAEGGERAAQVLGIGWLSPVIAAMVLHHRSRPVWRSGKFRLPAAVRGGRR